MKRIFQIPPEIREDFWQDTIKRNRLSLLVICIMIFGMELFNMLRVLFWSASGLGTVNNRIYFTMYFLLWMSAAIYLLRGGLELMPALPYLAGGALGGWAGGRIFRGMRMDWLRRIFGLLLIYGGVRSFL